MKYQSGGVERRGGRKERRKKAERVDPAFGYENGGARVRRRRGAKAEMRRGRGEGGGRGEEEKMGGDET